MAVNKRAVNPLFANPFDDPGSQMVVPYDRRDQILSDINQDNGGFLSDLFWALDTPGAVARGAMVDGLQGATDALWQNSEQRVDGRDLLRHYGAIGDEDNWYNFFGGLGAEVLLDPLSYVTGPVKAMTGAGAAAAKAGLLNNAPELLSRGYLRGGNIAPELAAAAESSLKRMGRTAVSETDVAGRPLIGRRAAYRHGTLDDLVRYSDDPDAARQSVLDALGGDTARYDKLAGQKLGRNFGIGVLPMTDPIASFDVPFVGDAFGDAMDAIGEFARWNPISRVANKYVNNAAGQSDDAASQALFQGAAKKADLAKAEARREAVYNAAKLYQAEPDVFSEQGNRALGRLIEDPVANKFAKEDAVWESSHPAARQYMDWWDQKRTELPEDFTEVGLRGATFEDPNISGYLPRRTHGALETAARNNPSLGRVLKTITSDQLQRSDDMMVPGGRDTLAFELSRDPVVAGAKRTASTDQEAARYIADKLYGAGEHSAEQTKQALSLSQILHRLPDSVTNAKTGIPLYGQHPTHSIMQYVEGRAGAKATMEAIYDSLASFAKASPSDIVEGGRHISMAEALNRVGARTTATDAGEAGARVQMRSRLADTFGIDPDAIELANVSVPEEAVDRLLRVREGFTSPKAIDEWTGLVDQYNRSWKTQILSWPSRIVRDLYSGAYSNWLEGAFDLESVSVTKRLAAGSAFDPEFQRWLASVPKYARIPEAERAATYYADLAAGGLIDGSFMADSGRYVGGGPITDMLVGTTPETFSGAAAELGRGWGNYAKEMFTHGDGLADWFRRTTEASPIVKFGAKAGNLADKINRLTGYNSLLKQGVDPMEAARRMKRAHVDYSSLTPQERYFRDKFMPFYAYWSRSGAEVLRQLAERPGGRYGQGVRALERAQQGEDGEYTPQAVRRGFAAQVDPDDPLFGWMAAPEGSARTYFTGIDLPGLGPLQTLDVDDPTQTLRNFAMQAHPGWRTLVELVNQRDLFTGTPLEYSSRGYGAASKLARAISGDQNAGRGTGYILADKAIDLFPGAARPARLLSGLFDQDSGVDLPTRVFHTAVNNAGIGRLRDFSEDDVRRDEIERLQQRAAPYTKEIASPYIPEYMAPFVPRDAQESLALARQLQREAREVRRQRREMGFGVDF